MKIILLQNHNREVEMVNTALATEMEKVRGEFPPLGLMYIASMLKRERNDEVEILDNYVENLSVQALGEVLKEKQPDLVGISTMTPTFKSALAAAKVAKETGAMVVMGGPQLSIYPNETLSHDCIDFGVVGEGEYPMVELAEALSSGTDYSGIEGLAYKTNGNVHINPERIVDDIDALPVPARDLIHHEMYSSAVALDPMTTMISSRGCPFHCGFCAKFPWDNKLRFRSAKMVVDEIEQVVKDYGVREVMFYDTVMTLKKDRIIEISDEIIRRGLKIKWETPTRVDLVDEEILAKIAEAGCSRLRYGVESGVPRILELMRKKTSLEQVRRVFRMTQAAGIEAFAYFMIGYPTETLETIKETIQFAIALKPDMAMFTATVAHPSTHLYELARQGGLIKTDYWRDFTLGETNEKLPFFVKDADLWAKKAYKKFYLRPAFFIHRLKKMRSWQDLSKAASAALMLMRMKD
ncbi:MAG: radical SAM protein [Candidatus Coatesbacteria bacterium]|nr:radical SAM protein [Candidatus Coatesbacteria bacterium]